MRDEGRANLVHTVGKGELELGNQELLDVWAANIIVLLDLHDTENLIESKVRIPLPQTSLETSYDVREWTGSEHGGGQPCPDREP